MHCFTATLQCTGLHCTIQNTVVQSIELQGNKGGTSKSCQNSSGIGIPKFVGSAPLMTVQLTANTGVAPVKGVPPAKVMSPWNGGTGIVKFSGASPLLTAQLTPIKGAVPANYSSFLV